LQFFLPREPSSGVRPSHSCIKSKRLEIVIELSSPYHSSFLNPSSATQFQGNPSDEGAR